MSMMKARLKELDGMIELFNKVREQYPKASYGEIVFKLQDERARLASKIGRNNVHPKQKRP